MKPTAPADLLPGAGAMRSRFRLLVPLALLALAAAGCNSGDLTLAEVDPEAVPAEPTYEEVRAILEVSCVPCHKSGKPEWPGPLGSDSPGGVFSTADGRPDYDTCEGIVSDPVGMLRTILDESMPPGAWPRLTEAEKLLITRWIETDLLTGEFSCTEVAP